MDRVWITNASTSVAPVVNSLVGACEAEFVPTDVYVLSNPTVDDVADRATSLMKTIVTAHGGDEPTITVESIEDETDFEAIYAYVQSSIEAGTAADAEIAVDITPGRRFWSVISFQAGLTQNVEHLYYSHVKSEAFFGDSFPTIPRTGVDLIDFTEVL